MYLKGFYSSPRYSRPLYIMVIKNIQDQVSSYRDILHTPSRRHFEVISFWPITIINDVSCLLVTSYLWL